MNLQMAKKKKNREKIDPNEIKTRDPLLVALINGATKSGVQSDKKKDADRKKCRKKVDERD